MLQPFLDEYANFSLQLIENDDSLSHDELLYLFNSNLAVRYQSLSLSILLVVRSS